MNAPGFRCLSDQPRLWLVQICSCHHDACFPGWDVFFLQSWLGTNFHPRKPATKCGWAVSSCTVCCTSTYRRNNSKFQQMLPTTSTTASVSTEHSVWTHLSLLVTSSKCPLLELNWRHAAVSCYVPGLNRRGEIKRTSRGYVKMNGLFPSTVWDEPFWTVSCLELFIIYLYNRGVVSIFKHFDLTMFWLGWTRRLFEAFYCTSYFFFDSTCLPFDGLSWNTRASENLQTPSPKTTMWKHGLKMKMSCTMCLILTDLHLTPCA